MTMSVFPTPASVRRALGSPRRLLPDGRQLGRDEFAIRQQWLTAVLVLHIPPLMAIGLFRGYSVAHLVAEIVVPVTLLSWISDMRALNSVVRAAVTTTGLTYCSSVLVHLTDGLIESHFHFFVLVPLVTLYQHWTPFLVTIGWVVFHHGVVGVLDPRSVYNHPAAVNSPIKWAVIHGAFVLAASVASLVTWRLNQNERERTELLLEASAQPLYGRDLHGRITMASRSLLELLGSSPDSVIGRHDHELLHIGPMQGCEVCAHVAEGTAEQLRHPKFEINGVRFPVDVSSRRVAAGGAFDGLAVSFSDVTLRQAHEEELRRRALYDELTGLANRTLLVEHLVSALGRMREDGGHVAVLFIDIDGFKLVNDSYGHAFGDQMLVKTAERLQEVTRNSETAGRIGGDEFVLVIPGLTRSEQAAGVARRVTASLATPFSIDGVDLAVTASVGVRVTNDPDDDPQTLLREADNALYVSKLQNRGGATEFDETMRTDAERQLRVANLLRRAAAEGEFHVDYQPQVDGGTGELVGYEALCRWRSAELGDVSPIEFIPLAERCGVIGDIGLFVLREAVATVRRWSVEQGLPDLRVSVNVSPHQLIDRALIDAVIQVIDGGSVAARNLVLEVTETTMMGTVTSALRHLSELRDLGVRVAVDDFGTGYSSLATLRALPADELKIDRAFVSGVADDQQNQEMIRVVVAMAEVLGLQVTAEGVESERDIQTVRQLGCDLIQGYAIGRPSPAPSTWGQNVPAPDSRRESRSTTA